MGYKRKGRARKLTDKTVSQLKNVLDDIFAKWVKLNWSLDGVYVKCYTCGKVMPVKGDKFTQAGHYISRSYTAVRWDENNVRPQCYMPCNSKAQGNGKPIEFERNLRAEVGDEVIDKMKARSTEVTKLSKIELIEKIEHYKAEVKALEVS